MRWSKNYMCHGEAFSSLWTALASERKRSLLLHTLPRASAHGPECCTSPAARWRRQPGICRVVHFQEGGGSTSHRYSEYAQANREGLRQLLGDSAIVPLDVPLRNDEGRTSVVRQSPLPSPALKT